SRLLESIARYSELPAGLSGVRALLSHPGLRISGALAHLGVDHVKVARRFTPPGSKNYSFASDA
ncbi:MAG: hypothetical protein WAN86_26230, partial [Hyphomicrobiaceae bacterium]